jgi:hypothetical protein
MKFKKEKEEEERDDFKYPGGSPAPDLISWKYIMLTMDRWAATDMGCSSFIALGVFTLLFIFTCSFIMNNFW